MIILMLAAALLMPQTATELTPCPVRVTRFEIPSRGNDALIYLENKAGVAVQAVEYQFEPYDPETRQTLGRYFLDAGKVPGGLGKPIAPGKIKPLSGAISDRLVFLYGSWVSNGRDIQINVVYFIDGSKWERKNPN